MKILNILRPETSLMDEFRYTAVPLETLKQYLAGFIEKAELFPSWRTRFLQHFYNLPARDKNKLMRITSADASNEATLYTPLALDYIGIKIRNDTLPRLQTRNTRKKIVHEIKYGGGFESDDSSRSFSPSALLDTKKGGLLSLAAALGSGAGYLLRYRFSHSDLLDPGNFIQSNTNVLQVLDVELNVTGEAARIEELTLLQRMAIKPVTVLQTPLSNSIQLGLSRYHGNAYEELVPAITLGRGLAYSSRHWLSYGFLNTNLWIDNKQKHGQEFAFDIDFVVQFKQERSRALLDIRRYFAVLGARDLWTEYNMEVDIDFSKNMVGFLQAREHDVGNSLAPNIFAGIKYYF